jgi:FkbM family methyltransferase
MNISPKTSVLNQARRFANKILSPAGVEIVRRPRRRISGTVSIRIGNYQISIQEQNELWIPYSQVPDHMGDLGRLAKQVFQVYPDALMIDVGANVGDTAAIVKTAVDVPIVCIEGDPAVFALLQQNIAPMKNVTTHQCFLGEKAETIKAVIEKGGWDSTIIPAEEGVASVESITLVPLDELVTKLPSQKKCKLLKVDVEGFELKVLRGATHVLKEHQPTVFLEWNHENLEKNGNTGPDILSYLQSLGYQDFLIYDSGGNFILPGKVSDSQLLQDLYDYLKSLPWLVYYDICVFPKQDSAIAHQLLLAERVRRNSLNRNHSS